MSTKLIGESKKSVINPVYIVLTEIETKRLEVKRGRVKTRGEVVWICCKELGECKKINCQISETRLMTNVGNFNNWWHEKKSIFIECKLLYMSPTWNFIEVYGCVWLNLFFKVRNICTEVLSKVTQWVDENKPDCYITEFIHLHTEIWLANTVVNLLFSQ